MKINKNLIIMLMKMNINYKKNKNNVRKVYK